MPTAKTAETAAAAAAAAAVMEAAVVVEAAAAVMETAVVVEAALTAPGAMVGPVVGPVGRVVRGTQRRQRQALAGTRCC